MKTRYKFLRLVNKKIKSNSGNTTWKIGEWQKHKGEIEMCESGFHCSKKVYQAFSYVQGEVLAVVECKGKSQVREDKEVYSEMRIIKAYKWTKEDSVDLAIYAAKQVLPIYEKEYPNDKRPRQAIEAAVAYKKCPCEKHRAAARAAAAWAAAARADDAAAWAARAAAWAAAARADDAAAWAARAAAWAAARAAAARATRAADAMIKKIDTWMTRRISKLEEII